MDVGEGKNVNLTDLNEKKRNWMLGEIFQGSDTSLFSCR